MKIVYIYADNPQEWNCSEWRCAVPTRAFRRDRRHMAQMFSIQDFTSHTAEVRTACEAADIILVQRNLRGPVLPAILHWKARGKVVVADFDDAYNLMPATNVSYGYWMLGEVVGTNGQKEKLNPPPLTQFRWGLRLVHAATVPSKRLADDWQAYTPVYYVPNYIDLEKYENIAPQPHSGLIIGWGGSMSHLQSFTGSGVAAALKRVCRARPQVKVAIHTSDYRVFEQLALPPEQKMLMPWVPYGEWPRQLAQFDIGLAPLHGAYDDRRSWIKVLEYMVMKIPWVASDSPAYADFRSYGWLVKNTPGAWERLLLDMVDHLADYREEAAREPYLFGISQAVDANVDKIAATYAAIIARAAEASPATGENTHA